MKRILWLPIAGAYLALSILTYGAMNAHFDYYCHTYWATICDDHFVRSNEAVAVAVAFHPPGWIVTFFITGFYQDGFVFLPKPE